MGMKKDSKKKIAKKAAKGKVKEAGWKKDYEVLSRYNAEVARGIVHTEQWKASMAEVQKEYNEVYLPKFHALEGNSVTLEKK